ncbi:hypothetical protein AURDEDRAFT_176867 [Auricularia subglabra TFB-10046 SS5]|uniref:F-box domain-containing protein n=1 Tax=Auricularia subglabra (strain TFB-10046 / SS5) TaxID=717982 RepID=J0CUR0_AURST|nr:hypothetical protein AURDEDRAFT_176867 [Auricularia subglabra TFB-10046 SS5]
MPPELLTVALAYLGLRDLIMASHVCGFWRDVALRSACLWTHISWANQSVDGLAHLLRRSRRLPIHLDLVVNLRDSTSDVAAMTHVTSHLSHILTLHVTICVSEGYTARMCNANSSYRPLNAEADIALALSNPAPVLEVLSVRIRPQCFYMSLPEFLFSEEAPRLCTVKLYGNFFGLPAYDRRLVPVRLSVLTHIKQLELASSDSLEILLSLWSHLGCLEKLVLLDGQRSRPTDVAGSHSPGWPRFPANLSHLILGLRGPSIALVLRCLSARSVQNIRIAYYPAVFTTLCHAGILTCERGSLDRLTIDGGDARDSLTISFGGASTKSVVIENVPRGSSAWLQGQPFEYITELSMDERAIIRAMLPKVTAIRIKIAACSDPGSPSILDWPWLVRGGRKQPLLFGPNRLGLRAASGALEWARAGVEALKRAVLEIATPSRPQIAGVIAPNNGDMTTPSPFYGAGDARIDEAFVPHTIGQQGVQAAAFEYAARAHPIDMPGAHVYGMNHEHDKRAFDLQHGQATPFEASVPFYGTDDGRIGTVTRRTSVPINDAPGAPFSGAFDQQHAQSSPLAMAFPTDSNALDPPTDWYGMGGERADGNLDQLRNQPRSPTVAFSTGAQFYGTGDTRADGTSDGRADRTFDSPHVQPSTPALVFAKNAPAIDALGARLDSFGGAGFGLVSAGGATSDWQLNAGLFQPADWVSTRHGPLVQQVSASGATFERTYRDAPFQPGVETVQRADFGAARHGALVQPSGADSATFDGAYYDALFQPGVEGVQRADLGAARHGALVQPGGAEGATRDIDSARRAALAQPGPVGAASGNVPRIPFDLTEYKFDDPDIVKILTCVRKFQDHNVPELVRQLALTAAAWAERLPSKKSQK